MDLRNPASASPRPGVLALLVGRDEDTRHMYAQYLRLAAYEVDEAEDGREALAKAVSRQYDVIVTETRLPGINGYELCDLLRRDAATRDTPIVVVTGEAYPPDIERAHCAGADVVLVKPCLPETLLAEMRRALEASTDPSPRSAASGARRLARSEDEPGYSAARRHILSRRHQRGDTTSPPAAPPSLLCPACDKPLIYQRSYLGGVSARQPEQWDYYECTSGCGTFQYRQRTRKLRRG